MNSKNHTYSHAVWIVLRGIWSRNHFPSSLVPGKRRVQIVRRELESSVGGVVGEERGMRRYKEWRWMWPVLHVTWQQNEKRRLSVQGYQPALFSVSNSDWQLKPLQLLCRVGHENCSTQNGVTTRISSKINFCSPLKISVKQKLQATSAAKI